MKNVLSVQDLSCLGKCSLTVAMPVLSAMGCTCTPLPTALLSTHTAFLNPYVRDLTEDLEKICRHWQAIGASFDAVSVGYLSDPGQAAAVEQVLDTFRAPLILDPALGDNGKLYSGVTQDHLAAMERLCHRATVLLPNVTEAALLTGTPYEQTTDPDYYRMLLALLQNFGPEAVILTGVSLEKGKIGYLGTGRRCGAFSRQVPLLPSCHGTGDLFAATFTGAYVQGRSVCESAALAAEFTERALAASVPSPFGLCFESHLVWLTQQQ